MMKKLLPFLILVSILFLIPTVQSSVEVDSTDVVNRVIDGDTFDVASGDRIRLADIDAPERGENGYQSAKSFLELLVQDKLVYLDIDDVFWTDRYGRLVCVVYVGYNLTHLINVNEALLFSGNAEIQNYQNEFSPYSWSLYARRPPTEPQSPDTPNILPVLPSPLWLLALLVVVLAGVIIVHVVTNKSRNLTKRKEYRVAGLVVFSFCAIVFGALFAIVLIECARASAPRLTLVRKQKNRLRSFKSSV